MRKHLRSISATALLLLAAACASSTEPTADDPFATGDGIEQVAEQTDDTQDLDQSARRARPDLRKAVR